MYHTGEQMWDICKKFVYSTLDFCRQRRKRVILKYFLSKNFALATSSKAHILSLFQSDKNNSSVVWGKDVCENVLLFKIK